MYNDCIFGSQVLQLNIQSNQSTIDSLDEKTEILKRSSRDGSLFGQIVQVVGRYDTLSEKAKVCLYLSVGTLNRWFYKEILTTLISGFYIHFSRLKTDCRIFV